MIPTDIVYKPTKSAQPKSLPLNKLLTILDKEADCVEPVFRNHRHPGAKTLSHKRQPKYPLYTLEDRLSRTNVISREEYSFTFRDNTIHLIDWKCTDTIHKDVNIHLIDYNKPPDQVDYRVSRGSTTHVVLLKLLSKTTSTTLIDTPAGRICPKCKTNEFIKSDLKNMPISYQDKHWRGIDSYGEHCQQCKTISVT